MSDIRNPFKPGSHNHRMLELYRENGYRVRASWTHHYCLSPTKVESNLKAEGFQIVIEKDPNSRDNWHVMTHDPFNPGHMVEGAEHNHQFKPEPVPGQDAVKLVCSIPWCDKVYGDDDD